MATHRTRTARIRTFLGRDGIPTICPEDFFFQDSVKLADGFNDYGGVFAHHTVLPGHKRVELVLGYRFDDQDLSETDLESGSELSREAIITRVAARTTINDGQSSWIILANCHTRIGYHNVCRDAMYYDYDGAVDRGLKNLRSLSEETRTSLQVIGGLYNFYTDLGLSMRKPVSLELLRSIHQDNFSSDDLIASCNESFLSPYQALMERQSAAIATDVVLPAQLEDERGYDPDSSVLPLEPEENAAQGQAIGLFPSEGGFPVLNEHGYQQISLMLESLYHSGRLLANNVGLSIPNRWGSKKKRFKVFLVIPDSGTESTRLRMLASYVLTQDSAHFMEEKGASGNKTRFEFITEDERLVAIMARRGYLALDGGPNAVGRRIAHNVHLNRWIDAIGT